MDAKTPIAAVALCALFVTAHCAPPSDSVATIATAADSAEHGERVWYRTVEIDGLDIFYREAGSKGHPGGSSPARIPDLVPHVPQPHAGPGR